MQTVDDDRDRVLVERHQAGDHDAFGELYARHQVRLIRYCRRLVHDPHLAEDLAQEAFLRAYRAVDRLSGPRRFYPWLTVIARRLVIDRLRQHGRFEYRAELEGGLSRAAEEEAVQRLDDDQVSTALARLNDRHRDVLRLRDWDELSYEAIARHLGVPTTTVAPLLHRARSALRREYLETTGSQAGLWVRLAPLLLAARRLRGRVIGWIGQLPDPGMLATPMAGAALGVAMFLAPDAPRHMPALAHTVEARIGSGAPVGQPQSGGSGGHEHGPGHHGHGPHGPSRERAEGGAVPDLGALPSTEEDYVVPGVIGFYGDPEKREERQEHIRQMPIYFEEEHTGIGFAADPDAMRRDIEGMLGQ